MLEKLRIADWWFFSKDKATCKKTSDNSIEGLTGLLLPFIEDEKEDVWRLTVSVSNSIG
ncbi:hypothetical protein [Sediminibacillus albus]|uniref:hypothetical protein n=1 Tax=Sediminibacillus albus TaxID=407036 RepID=UPI001587FF49|nr:hypothetical protein [Sediminibacillus albus]